MCYNEYTNSPLNVLLFSGTINHFKALMIKLHGTLTAAVLRAIRCFLFFPNKWMRKTCPNESTVWGNHVLKARRTKTQRAARQHFHRAENLLMPPPRPAESASEVGGNLLINQNRSIFSLTWQPPLKQKTGCIVDG